jgi:hypothetical protein
VNGSPALLGGLAGDAEPGADLDPGVIACARAFDGLGYGGVDLLGQAEHEAQGLDVDVHVGSSHSEDRWTSPDIARYRWTLAPEISLATLTSG